MNSEKQENRSVFKAVCRKFSRCIYLVLILFILIDIIFGGILLWRYGIRGEKREVLLPPPLILNQALLNEFSSRSAQKQVILETLSQKQYLDSFIGPIIGPTAESFEPISE